MPKPKDVALAMVGFPLLLLCASALGLWHWAHTLREKISIAVHGDRSEQ